MDVFKKGFMVYKVLPSLEVYRALIDLALMANGRSEFFQKCIRWKLESCATGCSAVRWMAACLRKVSNNPAVPLPPHLSLHKTSPRKGMLDKKSCSTLIQQSIRLIFYITEIFLF